VLTMVNSNMEAPRTKWPGLTRSVYPGGHNFATRRAVDFVIAKAKGNALWAEYVNLIYQTSLVDMEKDKDGTSDFVKTLVYGDFQNEVRVNIDGEGSMTLSTMALALRRSWLPDKDLSPDGVHSEWWTAATGYSSANPIHAMLQEAKPADPQYTQARSYDQMVTFAHEMIGQSIKLLRRSKGKGPTADWKRALRLIGSVLHTIQDSACSCTPRHWVIQEVAQQYKNDVYLGKLNIVRDCIPGDGHSVLTKQGDRFLVTGMSNTDFYDSRHDYHAQLDMLYEPGRVLDIATLAAAKTRKDINDAYDQQTTVLWGDNDPAYDGGMLILNIARLALTTQQPYAAAIDLTTTYLEGRYIARDQLKMPTQAEAKQLKATAQGH